jgi:transglutaminase-like putative cysteine protease
MIDAVRSLGLAARFVSGYIFMPDDAPPTPTSAISAGAISAGAISAGAISAGAISAAAISDTQPVSSDGHSAIDGPAAVAAASKVDARLKVDEGGATHAWLQVYLPGAGWVDFDPTNSIIGNRNLIRVAVAWSPMQVLPLWGTYIGSASACLGMQVAVSVTEEPNHADTLI